MGDQPQPVHPAAKQGFAPAQQVATQQAKIAQEEATSKGDQAAIEYTPSWAYEAGALPDKVAGIRLLDVGNIIHATTSRVLRASRTRWW
jgi:hypothetical protein